jgi:hypothetical protein
MMMIHELGLISKGVILVPRAFLVERKVRELMFNVSSGGGGGVQLQ